MTVVYPERAQGLQARAPRAGEQRRELVVGVRVDDIAPSCHGPPPAIGVLISLGEGTNGV
jgi:hypothetical protein